MLEGLEVVLLRDPVEEIKTGCQVAVHEPRLGEAQVNLQALERSAELQAQELALAHEVALGEPDVADDTFLRGVAGTERDLTRRLLDDRHIENDAVLSGAWTPFDVDALEQAKILKALLRRVHQKRIVGVAFGKSELAADHIVARAQVADDVDTLDINARAFVDHVGQRDHTTDRVAVGTRTDAGERVTTLGQRERQLLDGLVDLGRIEGAARAGDDVARQAGRIDARNLALDAHITEHIGLALLQHEGDEEARAVAIEMHVGGDHADVGEAVLEIVLAQKLAIEIQAVRIVERGAFEEVEPALLRRRDDVAELRVLEMAIADELDALDLRRTALVDLEDEIYATVIELDDLRLDGRGEAALAAIDVENALDVRLRLGARKDGARLELHLGLEGCALNLLVAFERNLIDDRVLGHVHDNCSTVPLDPHVGEEPGGEERRDGLIDARLAIGVADREAQVRPHSLGLHAPITDDLDFSDAEILRLSFDGE